MGPPFINLFASYCTSPSFVFAARFATPRMAFGPMCHLMCWLLSCGLCCFAMLADRWQVILGEFPGRCTQCPRNAHAVQQLGLRPFPRKVVQIPDAVRTRCVNCLEACACQAWAECGASMRRIPAVP